MRASRPELHLDDAAKSVGDAGCLHRGRHYGHPADEARAIEQALIVRNSGFENKIDSISPSQPCYQWAVDWGESWQRSSLSMATNLEVFKPSRSKPRAGDVFALRLGERFRFGRIISTEAMAGWSMPGSILIYIFRASSLELTMPDGELTRADNLLVAPLMTNRLPWSRGYFQTIGNRPLAPGDVLAQHCFRSSNGRYFDESARELPGPIEPCGDWGLHSYRTIDDEVSAALGIPRAPEADQ